MQHIIYLITNTSTGEEYTQKLPVTVDPNDWIASNDKMATRYHWEWQAYEGWRENVMFPVSEMRTL